MSPETRLVASTRRPPDTLAGGAWLALLCSVVVLFLAGGARMAYSAFVVPLSEAFGWSRAQASQPYAFSMLCWGAAQPFAGMLMDRYGERRVILWGLAALGASLVAAAGIENLWQLNLTYGVLLGIASSGAGTASFSLFMARWFEARDRGLTTGLVLAAMPASAVLFSPVSMAIIATLGWREAFFFLGLVVLLLALPLGWLFLRDRTPTEHARGPVAADSRRRTGGPLFSGEVLEALKSRPFWLILTSYGSCGLTGFFIGVHIVPIALHHDFSPAVGAVALAVIGGGSALGALAGGWASDRLGRARVLAATFFVRAVGFLLLATGISHAPGFLLYAFLGGAPIFATVTVTQTVVYECFGPRIAGRMLGLVFLLHQVGSTVGPLFGGAIYDWTGSYGIALLVGAGALFGSTLIAWRLGAELKEHTASAAR